MQEPTFSTDFLFEVGRGWNRIRLADSHSTEQHVALYTWVRPPGLASARVLPAIWSVRTSRPLRALRARPARLGIVVRLSRPPLRRRAARPRCRLPLCPCRLCVGSPGRRRALPCCRGCCGRPRVGALPPAIAADVAVPGWGRPVAGAAAAPPPRDQHRCWPSGGGAAGVAALLPAAAAVVDAPRWGGPATVATDAAGPTGGSPLSPPRDVHAPRLLYLISVRYPGSPPFPGLHPNMVWNLTLVSPWALSNVLPTSMTRVALARGLIAALRRMLSACALPLVRAALSPLPTSPLDLIFFEPDRGRAR